MKRVLVTGAAGGIGAAACEELHAWGAAVAGLDLTDGDGVIACDVRDQGSVDAAVAAAVDLLGGLDVVVNNAGLGDAADSGKPPDRRAVELIDVNLLGPWRVTSAAMPALLRSRGRVVNVASGLSHLSAPFAAAYCMSKRGLVAYSDVLRLEYRGRIEVTTVYPGYIRTAIHDGPAAKDVALDGLVPPERLADAARTIARAALGPPARDLATTRSGAVAYSVLSRLPRRLLDRLVDARLRRHARSGRFAESELTSGYRERLSG